jgi:hypothetical protein
MMADKAADMVGVNTHINYTGSIYDKRYSDIIKPRLVELGVRHIRDNAGDSSTVKDRFIDLAQSGVRVLIINHQTSKHGWVKEMNSRVPGLQVVEAVEPTNEADIMGPSGANYIDHLRNFIPSLDDNYKSDPATRDLPFLGPSFANNRDRANELLAAWPQAGNYMDYANVHDYSGRDPEGQFGGGWGQSLDASLSRAQLGTDRAVWSTENGYKMSCSKKGHPAVTQKAAAKYLPRQLLSHLNRNASRLYIYQLINNSEDFGLLNDDGSPRQQFTAVKNFISLFKDPGTPFTTEKLDYTIRRRGQADSDDLASIQRSELQKRDGRFYLVLWQGVPSSEATEADSGIGDIEPPRRNLKVKLDTKITSARIYEPSFSAHALSTHSDPDGIRTLSVSVPDHLLVVELKP